MFCVCICWFLDAHDRRPPGSRFTSLHLSFADRGLGVSDAKSAMTDADVEAILCGCLKLKHLDLSDNYLYAEDERAVSFTGRFCPLLLARACRFRRRTRCVVPSTLVHNVLQLIASVR